MIGEHNFNEIHFQTRSQLLLNLLFFVAAVVQSDCFVNDGIDGYWTRAIEPKHEKNQRI